MLNWRTEFPTWKDDIDHVQGRALLRLVRVDDEGFPVEPVEYMFLPAYIDLAWGSGDDRLYFDHYSLFLPEWTPMGEFVDDGDGNMDRDKEQMYRTLTKGRLWSSNDERHYLLTGWIPFTELV